VQALVDQAKQSPRGSSKKTNNYDFTGTHSFEEAVELAEKGWKEGASRVESLRAAIAAPILQGLEKVVEFNVAPGEWVDPDRFLSGQAEVFGSLVDTESFSVSARGKYAHFVVSAAFSASVDKANIQARGATIAAAVDILEAVGYRVKVTVIQSIYGYNSKSSKVLSVSTTIKEHEAPLDIDSIAFSLTHASFLRRIIFGVEECQKEEILKGWGFAGYGSYGIPTNEYPSTLVDDNEEPTYFECMFHNNPAYNNVTACRATVVEICKKYGIHLELEGT
jgi:DNA-binding protein